MWKTQPGNEGNYAYVEIKGCDGKICGEMLKAFDSSDKEIESKNIGRNIILGMSPKKNGKYGGGKIWAPDEDKTYRSKMKLVSDNDLKVSFLSLSGHFFLGETESPINFRFLQLLLCRFHSLYKLDVVLDY